MIKKSMSILVASMSLGGWLNLATASSVSLPNTFTAGTKAVAAQVNANFTAVKAAADDNNSRIAALEKEVKTLETKMSSVNSSQVMTLNKYLSVITSDPKHPLVQFHGANVQVVNGMGKTDSANGLGNLIIGYNEADSSGVGHCTIGTDPSTYTPVIDANTCATAGGLWTTTGFKTGSHYLVMGTQNNYSRWGGMVMGVSNTSNYDYASVLGGGGNASGGYGSSVSGGNGNTASGDESSVSGGSSNTASGDESSVSGSSSNIASGQYSSVSGGNGNTASGSNSSVSGGYGNTASGRFSSVSGGSNNAASGSSNGSSSSVSGGYGNTASGRFSSVSGGSNNAASGYGNSISGGYTNTTGGQFSSVSGGLNRSAPNNDNWAAGGLLENY